MIEISKNEALFMRANGFENEVHMSSATHKARAKRYWLTEDRKALRKLNSYRKSIGHTF